MNLLDQLISIVSPSLALTRAKNKMALRNYEGARRDRRTLGWNTSNNNNDTLLRELPLLSQRSEDLYDNDPHAFSAHTTIYQSVIGTGILPAIKDKGIKMAFDNWADSLSCDFDGDLNFYGLQALAMQTMSVYGNALILRVKTDEKVNLPIQLKVITTSFLDKTKDTAPLSKGNFIKGGIEFNEKGKRVAYHIYNQDPTEFPLATSSRWSAEDVIHLFNKNKPNRIFGVPSGAASITTLRDYNDYADAQLLKQKLSACTMAFVENEEGQGDDPLEKLEPGTIQYLAPGEKVTFSNPPNSEGFNEYSRGVLSSVSAGFKTTYETTTNDLSNVNFSSGKMGLNEAYKNFQHLQYNIIIPKLCQGVWNWVREALLLKGFKNVPLNVVWTPPARQMIDPIKETNGLKEQVRAGFTSYPEAVRTLGYQPDDVIEEAKAYADLIDKAGLKFTSDARFDPSRKEEIADEDDKED